MLAMLAGVMIIIHGHDYPEDREDLENEKKDDEAAEDEEGCDDGDDHDLCVVYSSHVSNQSADLPRDPVKAVFGQA